MGTQDSTTTVRLPEAAAKKSQGLVRATVEKLIDALESWPALDGLLVSDEIPVAIPPKLIADIDGDLLPTRCDPPRKRMTLQPDITDEEMAEYLASAKNENCEQWLSAHRDTLENPVRIIAVWMLATLALLGFLTVMLIVGIAISV